MLNRPQKIALGEMRCPREQGEGIRRLLPTDGWAPTANSSTSDQRHEKVRQQRRNCEDVEVRRRRSRRPRRLRSGRFQSLAPGREPAGRTRTSGLPRVMQGHLTEEAASAAIKRFFCASLGRDGRIGSRGPVIFRYDDLLYPGGVINSV